MTSGRAKSNPYRKARFALSAHRLAQLPEDSGREVAFAGRSNSGKSSAINCLTAQKSLARTSKTPGRTQQIVIFDLGANRRIADLPGYGYARVPEKLKAHWRHEMQAYFDRRRSLCGVVLIMDVRHPLREFDTLMLEWCTLSRVPCHILLNKSDKLNRAAARSSLNQVRKALVQGTSVQLFSARSGEGLDTLIERLDDWFGFDGPQPPD